MGMPHCVRRHPSYVAVAIAGGSLAWAALGGAIAAVGAPAAAPIDSAGTVGSRLGRAVVPLSQKVELRLDPASPDYTGSTTISIEAAAPFRSLRVHAREMSVETILLAGGLVHVAPKWASETDGTIHITFAEPVPAGIYLLTLRFRNDFNTQATSLYRLKAGDDWYCFTQFEATDAREAFPCFDEPEFKIPWDFELTIPSGHSAVANTPIVSSAPAGDGWTKHVFKRSKPMPTYILAIATGPLEMTPIEGMSIPGNVVTVKGQATLTAEARRVAPPILAALEAYFGRPYPYEKLDLLAVPEFWPGAMENAGAITFADGVLLLDDKTATVSMRRSLASTQTLEPVAMLVIHLIIFFKNMRQAFCAYAYASVHDLKLQHIVNFLTTHFHAAKIRVAYGIRYQIAQDAFQQVRVAVGDRPGFHHDQFEVLGKC